MKTASCVLKVELLPSPPEVIVGEVQERKLMHVDFEDTVDATMRCYELREIASMLNRFFIRASSQQIR